MRFLIDNSLSPLVAQGLQEAGHDVVHVRDLNMQRAADEEIMARALRERRVVVAADTDFGTLLAWGKGQGPSVIVFRRVSQRRPDAQVRLLLANLPAIEESLEKGSIVVIEDDRMRVRPLPI